MANPSLLIVDDEENLRSALSDFMEGEGFDVSTAESGPTALKAATENKYDIIILDVMLPDINGFDVCKMLRAENITTPIIMLTAKSEEIDKILGLEMGADDYLTKPFSSRELLARVRAILRRSQKPNQERIFQFGDNTLDTVRQELKHNDAIVPLTRKEYELLNFFLDNLEVVLSRDRLLEEVWGFESNPTTRTVDTHVLSLRQKIEKNPREPQHIQTAHGQGYKFVNKSTQS